MSSEVRGVTDESGRQAGAAWPRRLRLDGSAVYSGCYRSALLPGRDQPHVTVAFPLELGPIRTDHELRGGRFRALRLHYRLERLS